MVTWIAERSINALREPLVHLVPPLAGRPIALQDGWVDTQDPRWAASSAFVGDAWVVKFAWTEPAARKLAHEISVLLALAASSAPVPAPRVLAWSHDPVLVVSQYVAGTSLTGELVARLAPRARDRLAAELARTLSNVHDRRTAAVLARAGVALAPPPPQADTSALRARLAPRFDARRRAVVLTWCDWVDVTIASEDGCEHVVLHGDFHGYKLIVDATCRVRAVVDLEARRSATTTTTSATSRRRPRRSDSIGRWRRYAEASGRAVVAARVMAWPMRAVLGDALWRTEAGVELPGGGTPERWVDEFGRRMTELGVDV